MGNFSTNDIKKILSPTNKKLSATCRKLDIIAENTGGTTVTTIGMCDDVAGNGSNIVKYVDAYVITYDGNVHTSTNLGSYTDTSLTTSYTPINPTDCNGIGVEPIRKQGRVVFTNSVWSPNPLTASYTIKVNGTGASFTDSFGTTTTLLDGEVIEFTSNGTLLSDTTAVVTSTGATISINFVDIV